MTASTDRSTYFIAADKALTSAEREAFLDRFPRQHGAQVADILDMMDNADANLELIEAMYDEHGSEVGETGLLSTACHVCVVLGQTTWADISSMVARIRQQADESVSA
ncbi:hypothetical protein [Pseudomonas aeruginosa]|uniref:hypothetical protein n=1 Tax=Pseudomonas aeruginosa TaxID=287 RepID=UPI000EB5FAEA|nr:hypothetical protein [Pseudomonas aeruginosa]